MEESTPKRSKLILTGTLCVSYTALGFAFGLFGPSLIDITEQIHSNQKDVAYVISAKAFACCFAALAFGRLFDHFNRQLGVALSLVSVSVLTAMVPLCKSIISLTAQQLGYGLSIAALEVASNAWVLELWKQDANPYMQALHFAFALGTAIGPFICEPFLSNDHGRGKNGSNSTSTATAAPLNVLTAATAAPPAASPSRIWIPFLIGAFCLITVAIMQLVLYIRLPYKTEDRSQRKENNNEDVNDKEKLTVGVLPQSYFLTVVTLGALLLCFEGGNELNTFNYLQTFVVNSKLQLSKFTGALMSGTLNTAFTVSRGLSIFVAMKLRTLTMLYMNLTVIMAGNVIVFFSATFGSVMGMWVGIVILGFGFSSTWPAVFAFVEERISVTNSVCSIFLFATTLHAAVGPLLEGHFIEKSPMVFPYINVVSGAICCVAFGTLHWTDFWKKRFVTQINLSNLG